MDDTAAAATTTKTKSPAVRNMRDALRTSPRKARLSWKLHKRRLQFQLLTNFGKELPPADDLYEHHEQRFLGLLQKLLDIRKSLDHYRTKALPEYCAACATLGADVWCVVGADAVGKGTDAERFRHAMCAINETKEMKNHHFNADEVLAGALRFLDIHINAMKSVMSQIEHRKRVKLDYDCYERKVARLKERSSTSVKLLERNQLKLSRATEALQVVTLDLYRVFSKYESERDTMLNGELEMVRQVMHGFYTKNAQATGFSIHEDIDRAAIVARTEQIFKQMVARDPLAAGLAGAGSPASLVPEPQSPAITTSSVSTGGSNNGGGGGGGGAGLLLPPAPMPAFFALVPDLASAERPGTDTGPKVQQPETTGGAEGTASSDDDLSEKLRTIQLSRPKLPVPRAIGLKRPHNNQILDR